MRDAAIEQVRRFHRIVTERIGALDDGYLQRGRPLGQARLLWEIGPRGADVKELRARLGLDSGYVSRMLRALEEDGLVTVGASAEDGRVRVVRLTEAGRAERAALDRGSDALAGSVLAPLSDPQRQKLLAAMADVERLLRASMIRIAPEDPTSPDARWCLAQYFAELDRRFEGGFDASGTSPPSDLVAPRGVFLVARLRDAPVACGAVKLPATGPAYLKRMWTSPDVRGLGLGRRLLAELERHAAEGGATRIHLETNRVLSEAIALYRSAGYVEVPAFNDDPYGHHWFEKTLQP